MSQQQVEVVRAHIEAFRSQDAARTLSFLDPHVVLDVSRTGGDEEAIYGRAAIAEFMRRWVGTFEDYRYEVERLTDLGSGAVLAVVIETGRGKGSCALSTQSGHRETGSPVSLSTRPRWSGDGPMSSPALRVWLATRRQEVASCKSGSPVGKTGDVR